MERLITMTDFVLEQKDWFGDKYKMLIDGYANFLKQPLKLGYFIPCDLEGNVLKTHQHFPNREMAEAYNHKFKEAQERVLFKDINLDGLDMLKHHINQKRTIEYMVQFNLELTENAKKQFNLN